MQLATTEEWQKVVDKLCEYADVRALIDDLTLGPPRIPVLAYCLDELVEDLLGSGLDLDKFYMQISESPLGEEGRVIFSQVWSDTQTLKGLSNRHGPLDEVEMMSDVRAFSRSCARLKDLRDHSMLY
jgi:hypothetical protein